MRSAFLLLALLALPGLAAAQAPPSHAQRPAERKPGTPAAKPPRPAPAHPTPARPTPAHPTPTVRPKPGAPAHHPPGRPAARPAAPAPAPAPAPPPPEPEKPVEPLKGANTGLPLPRFAALRSEEVNLRTGPGLRYPVEWVYKRRDLPVQIEREFEVWRLVRDQEGVKGWVHQATLAPRRTAVVIGGEHVLRASADDASAAVAKLKPGVILRLRSCEAGADWCQAQVGDYRGWIKRSEIWGTFPGEAIQ